MNNLTERYPTGTEYEVYMSDPLDGGETDAITPDFSSMTPLDAKSLSLIEDGEVTPLYDAFQHNPDHFAYSRRQVNGALQMHFTEEFSNRYRRPLQSIRDKTLWVVLNYTQWQPVRQVEDVYRISSVYERPFRHDPRPTAIEQVPFSGRDLRLVERRSATLDDNLLADMSRDEDAFEVSASDLFRERQKRYLATVVSAEDGDTVTVRLDSTQQELTIRLAGVDTPEKQSGLSRKKDNDPTAWESLIKKNDYLSVDQLDVWGKFIRDEARKWLGLTSDRSRKVWLVTDPATAPTGAFGRYVFRIETTEPLPAPDRVSRTNEYGRHLIRMGYALTYPSDSTYVDASAHKQYQDYSAVLENAEEQAADKHGDDSQMAAGIWYSPKVSDWKNVDGIPY
jgi:endonuclease YncB( thermonuclease family)